MRSGAGAGVVGAGIALALVMPAGVAHAGVTKSTFTGVTLTDASATVDDAVITSSVKETKKSTYTVCDYYTSGFVTYLGQYAAATAPQPDTEQFCIDNYPNRSS